MRNIKLSIEAAVERLTSRRRFAFVKVNHGIWERLVALERLEAAGVKDPDELERRAKQRPDWADGGFLHEFRAAVSREQSDDFVLSATPYAWPSSRRIEGTPSRPLEAVTALIRSHVPPDALTDDGLMWKAAVYDGRFAAVIEALRDRATVLVGPHWLRHFGAFAGIRGFRLFEIHESRARDFRKDIFERLYLTCRSIEDVVVLISAGHLSPLIVSELKDRLPNASFLDLGGVLDICHVPTIARRSWAIVRRADVCAAIEAIHPGWPNDARAYDAGTSGEERRSQWLRFSQGVDPGVADALGLAQRLSNPSLLDRADLDAGTVPFVEPKRPDWDRIAEICSLSQREDRWANFGPVVRVLASVLQDMLRVPEDREVVPASSATAALHALVGAHAVRAGRPLFWAVSAFGFPSTAVGPLAGCARVVDCDERGFLDLRRLAELDPDSFDGVIVTNTFGAAEDFARYRAFCDERGKRLVVDSATSFDGARAHADSADEVVSLHHTKPWGFGEGGFAVVPRDMAQTVRNLLNFGFETDPAFHRFAANGKLSDPAAAAILERLERRPSWSTFYRMQHNRIRRLARQNGASFLSQPAGASLKGNIAILAPGRIDLGSVPPARFVVRKYYRPLASGNPVAEGLYRRILNVPCHPGMAAVPTNELSAFFSAIAGRSRS